MKFDFIVIGSGLAGLTSALVLKNKGKVLLLSKSTLIDTATNLAQGGICAVVEKKDSFQSHIRDTLTAGASHNKREAVEYMVRNAPLAIDWLVTQGVKFDMKNGQFAPTKEAAHSHRRVLHATDFTGQEIERALVAKVKSEKNITIWENCFVLDLLVEKKRCLGAILICGFCHLNNFAEVSKDFSAHLPNSPLDKLGAQTVWACSKNLPPRKILHPSRHPLLKNSEIDLKVFNLFSKAVILATGGLGQIYEWTTNPEVATGDGLAMAERAGCKFVDLEFIQFHPTALKPASRRAGHGRSPLFLLSEALRGEGAYLIKLKAQSSKLKNIQEGERFIEKYDSRGELAPRDIVARAIFTEQKKGNNVFLDIRHKGATFIKKRFPNIYEELKTRGFDLASEPVPVTPAVHYSCGGVKVDLYGRTNIKNLFAYGEVACSGVHGANRLASNSLLETVVFPLRLKEVVRELSKEVKKVGKTEEAKTPPRWPKGLLGGGGNRKSLIAVRRKLQKLMWEKVGIMRDMGEMSEALEQIERWEREIREYDGFNKEIVEMKNMLTAARLVTEAALKRRQSLGGHFVR